MFAPMSTSLRFSVLLPVWVFVMSSSLTGQGVVSGIVQETVTGEAVIGANVIVVGQGRGAATNRYGFFSISGVPPGLHELRVSAVGYATAVLPLVVKEGEPLPRLRIELRDAVIELGEVSIEAERHSAGFARVSAVDLPVDQVLRIPSLGGEPDIFRALQLLPGVKASSELSSGLYIRGGSPDQNLVLLDRMVLYNPMHLGGFLSTFNADALNNVTLLKGAMPAEYGGRMSSVVDVTMREGSRDRPHVRGGVSMIDARLTVEGPVGDDATFMVSGRRVYLDWLVSAFSDEAFDYYFYDLVTKTNIRLGERDRIYFSGFFGRDLMGAGDSGDSEDGASWGNSAGNLRWTHIFGDRLFTNVSFVASDYFFGTEAEEWDKRRFKSESGIFDYTVRAEAEYFHSPEHLLKAGVEATLHTFKAEASHISSEFLDFDRYLPTHRGNEISLFVQDEWKQSERLTLQLGTRAFYFDRGRYFRLEPRFAASYRLDAETTLKGSFVGANQFLHLVSRTDLSMPTDMWFPSTATLPPAWGLQYVLGVSREFGNGDFNASIEGYYRDMQNVLEFRDNAAFSVFAPVEQELTRGEGEAYGAELFVQKRMGRLTGWIGYTLSWTDRTFPDLNDGRPFPPRYDRRHDASIVLNYRLGERWEFTATWVYGTGQALTMPIAQYAVGSNGGPMLIYGDRNAYRLPAYHRLDLNFSHSFSWFGWSWRASINVYNAYNRMNPFSRYLAYDYAPGGETVWQMKQTTLFPILPTFGVSFAY